RSAATVVATGGAAHADPLRAGAKPLRLPAARGGVPRHIDARDGARGSAQAGRQADDRRCAAHEVPVKGIDGSRSNPYQHAVVIDQRLLDVSEFEYIRRAVRGLDDRFHRVLPRFGRTPEGYLVLTCGLEGLDPDRCHGSRLPSDAIACRHFLARSIIPIRSTPPRKTRRSNVEGTFRHWISQMSRIWVCRIWNSSCAMVSSE